MRPLGTTRVAAVLLAASLFAATVLAGRDDLWKHKPASQWTVEDALKVLQDSPWARKQVVVAPRLRQDGDLRVDVGLGNCDPDAVDANGNCLQRRPGLPLDPSRRPEIAFANYPTVVFLVRWESATPVARAFDRLAELGARASANFQSPPPRQPSDRYIVTVRALEARSEGGDIFAGYADRKPKPQAWLKTPAGTVAAAEWERSGVGANSALHFFFPRTLNGVPLLSPRRQTVEFSLQAEQFTLKCKFTLDPESTL